MKKRSDLVLLVTALFIVVALAVLRPQQQEQPSTYSSYDTGRNGYRAVYEVLRREGVASRRFTGELGTLHGFSGTIVVSPNYFGSVLLDKPEAQRLAILVRGGADVVVLGAPASALGKALSLPETHDIDAVKVARGVPGTFTRSLARVAAGFVSAFGRRRGVHGLLTARGRPTAIEYPLGRGNVIAITAPDVFSNSNLASEQNAWFAYDLLSIKTPVLFDESLHGYMEGTSMWAVLPAPVHEAVWIAVAIVLLALIGGIFRSAPPVVIDPARPRDSSAYLAAMASLLRRARAGEAAIERFTNDAQRLAKARRSLATRSDIAAGLDTLSEMYAIDRPSDAAVLSAAQIYAHLRKELAK